MAATATRGSSRAGRSGRANGVTATVAGRPRVGQSKEMRKTDAGQFGQHLEMLIDKSGLTVKEFAESVKREKPDESDSGKVRLEKISTDAVYHWINGTRQPPFRHWRKIIAVLNRHLPDTDRLENFRDLIPSIAVK